MGNMNLPAWVLPVKRLVLSHKTGDWCRLPYANHPKGCPNYEQKPRCPPKASWLPKVVDVNRPLFLVHSEFSLRDHVSKMRAKHPGWSERQLRNVLYWQATSRKQLKERVAFAKMYTFATMIFYCPEAHGLNVYATCKKSGLNLEKIRRLAICRHVALLGFPFNKNGA